MKTRSSEVILLGIFLAFYELVPKDHFLRKVEEDSLTLSTLKII